MSFELKLLSIIQAKEFGKILVKELCISMPGINQRWSIVIRQSICYVFVDGNPTAV